MTEWWVAAPVCLSQAERPVPSDTGSRFRSYITKLPLSVAKPPTSLFPQRRETCSSRGVFHVLLLDVPSVTIA